MAGAGASAAGGSLGSSIGGNSGLGGLINSIFGSETEVTTSQAVNTVSSQDTTELIKALLSATEDTTSSAESIAAIETLSEEDRDALSDLVGSLTSQLTGASPSAVDFDALQASTIEQILESGLGNVIESATNAGAFDSTVQATAAERLGARASTESQKVVSDAKLQEQRDLIAGIEGLFTVLKGAQETQTTAQETAGTSVSTETAQTAKETEVDSIVKSGSSQIVESGEEGLLEDIFGFTQR